MESVKKRSKAHQRYTTKDGRPCVGVTTALGMKAKPYLIPWANKLGLDGIDSSKYVDALASVGTLIHLFVECDVKGIKADTGDFTPNELEAAKSAFFKWKKWRTDNKFVLVASELQLASDEFQYGGTIDLLGIINGRLTIADIKTSKSVYEEQKTQVAAYKKLVVENKDKIVSLLPQGFEWHEPECRIIRIGRNENEGFDDTLVGAHEIHWRVFKACLDLYWADKALKNVG